MTHYSVAEAKNNLPKLLDRMLAGEEVVITRRGKAIARLNPEEKATAAGFKRGLEWLDANWVSPAAGSTNGVGGVEEMRREYRYSLDEAQTDLDRLVVEAERGENVIIDRPDPDVVIKLVAQRVRPNGPCDIEWLRSVMITPRRGKVDTAALLKQVKTEDLR